MDLPRIKDGELDSLGPMVYGKKHGEWVGFRNGQLVYREFYDFGKLISGERYQKEVLTSNYKSLYTLPQPTAGDEEFLSLLRMSVAYPKSARTLGISGEVKLRMYFDKNGELSNTNVLKSIGHGAHQKIIKALKQGPGWKPALVRGVPVKASRVLSVKFKLVNSMLG